MTAHCGIESHRGRTSQHKDMPRVLVWLAFRMYSLSELFLDLGYRLSDGRSYHDVVWHDGPRKR